MMPQSVAHETRAARGATGTHSAGSGGATPPPATTSSDLPLPYLPPPRRLALYMTGPGRAVVEALARLAERDAWRGGAA